MNKKVYITFRVYLIASFILFSQLLWAQQKTDSILNQATRQIYTEPSLAIESLQELLKETDVTVNIKVKALIIISTAYSSKREYEKSLSYALEAATFLPEIDDAEQKISLLNRIGGQYQELNVYDKSMTYLDDAFELLQTLPENVYKLQGLGFNNLIRGFIYREQLSCDIALEYFDKAIKVYTQALRNVNVNANLSIAYYNKGNCLLNLEKTTKAKESFLQSISYAKVNNSKSLIAFAQKGLAGVYTTEDNRTKAINLLLEALQNAEEVGDKILNRSIYDALAFNYLETNEVKKYELYQTKGLNINKEIINTERKSIDNSLKSSMDEIEHKTTQINNRNVTYQTVLLLLIVFMMVLLLNVIFSSEKKLKHLKKKLKL